VIDAYAAADVSRGKATMIWPGPFAEPGIIIIGLTIGVLESAGRNPTHPHRRNEWGTHL